MNYSYDDLSDQENMALTANKHKSPSTGPAKRIKSSQPKPASVSRRNARERRRVKQVNDGFVVLRDHVPKGQKNKKLSKVETLKAAIDYIQQLSTMLGADIGQLGGQLGQLTEALIKDECSSETSLSPPPSQTSDESVNSDASDASNQNDSWNSTGFVQDYAGDMNQYNDFHQCAGYVIADSEYADQPAHYQDISASLPSYYPPVFQNSLTHSPTYSQNSEMSPGFAEQCNQFNNVFNDIRTSSMLL